MRKHKSFTFLHLISLYLSVLLAFKQLSEVENNNSDDKLISNFENKKENYIVIK